VIVGLEPHTNGFVSISQQSKNDCRLTSLNGWILHKLVKSSRIDEAEPELTERSQLREGSQRTTET